LFDSHVRKFLIPRQSQFDTVSSNANETRSVSSLVFNATNDMDVAVAGDPISATVDEPAMAALRSVLRRRDGERLDRSDASPVGPAAFPNLASFETLEDNGAKLSSEFGEFGEPYIVLGGDGKDVEFRWRLKRAAPPRRGRILLSGAVPAVYFNTRPALNFLHQ
jgi:hypothetical protein